MRYPDEDPIIFDVADDPEPAPVKGARTSSVVEILHPLARSEEPAKPEAASESEVLPTPARRLSWFQRSLLVAGALAIIALTFVSGIYFGSYWQSVQPAENPADNVAGPIDARVGKEPDGPRSVSSDQNRSDLVPDENTPPAFDKLTPARSAVRRRHVRPRTTFAAYHPRFLFAADRPRPRPIRPPFWVSDFVPTTLVIYVKNGEVKTRIESWAPTGYK